MSALPVYAPVPARVPVPSRPAAAPRPRRDLDGLLAELHERHEAELLRFCRWMLKDRDDAADAVQDTWIRAMTALGDGAVRVAAHRPWLFAIARNVCLDRLRDRKRASVHEAEEADFGDTPGADEVVALRQEADAALALVGSLSERQRSALLMRELAGMSVPDIATALGLTVDKAHWTIADARRALDEARSGSSLACEEVRTRIGAGHRGRGVRSHLAGCPDCRAHDRRQRARRVLLLLPIGWLPRLWAIPATVAALSVPVISAIETPRHAQPPAAPAPQVVRDTPQRPAVDETRPTGRFVRPQVAATRRVSRTERPAAPRANGHATAPSAPAPAAAVAPAAPAAAQPSPKPAAALVEPVARTVETVARTTAKVPVAGPVVDEAAAQATAVLRQVGTGL